MNRFFYGRLAAVNIRTNRRVYIPFLLTCILMTAMHYIIGTMAQNEGFRQLPGGDSIASMLEAGVFVTAIFAVIFLFYTNSFLMKRRTKEFGLYNILGMEKKHVARVVGFETLWIALVSIPAGILAGMLLGRLLFLLLLKMAGSDVMTYTAVSWYAAKNTVLLFGGIFLLILLNSLRQIHLAKPIELLKGGNVGEKEPKARWIPAVLGFLCLGTGYTMAVAITNPIAALNSFFVAVVLVILGTYLLFTAGSIALLKLLRRNKRYYYKTSHFISVSGMIYRMKQNAVGLGNICILSTIILVMCSTTLSLYSGLESILNTMFVRDMLITVSQDTAEHVAAVDEAVNAVLREKGLEKSGEFRYGALNVATRKKGDTFIANQQETMAELNDLCNLFFMTLEDYNRESGKNETLEDSNQVIVYSSREKYDQKRLKIFDLDFSVKEVTEDFITHDRVSTDVANSHFVIVRDSAVLEHVEAMQKLNFGENAAETVCYMGFDLSGTPEQKAEAHWEINERLDRRNFKGRFKSRDESGGKFLALYGGFFFLGAFLGILFLFAMVLIMYYKQISEGYEDQERYGILQKVGLSRSEVRKTIRSQVLTVFFLPLAVAGVHIAFAFPAVTRLMDMFHMRDTQLFAWTTVGCFAVFAVLYFIVYSFTAGTYYKIVSQGSGGKRKG